jgi:hypothetical protein
VITESHNPAFSVASLNLEDLVLAYMGSAKAGSPHLMLEGTQ